MRWDKVVTAWLVPVASASVVQGLLGHLLPTEAQEAKRIARQARHECDALFQSAADLFATATDPPDAGGDSLPRDEPQRPSQETASDR